MLVLGLTGSIGMGKSTVAAMFAARGVPVFDADARRARASIAGAAVPVGRGGLSRHDRSDGAVDRDRLARPGARRRAGAGALEAIVHPLVRREEETLPRRRRGRAGRRLVVLDIPLLFETGGEARVDAVVVVSAAGRGAARARARPAGHDAGDSSTAILARQMPDAEKRRRAHFVIDTGGDARRRRARQVDAILRASPRWRLADSRRR